MKRLAARSREIPESVVIIVWLLSQNLIKNGNLFDCFSIIFFWSQRWTMPVTTNIFGIIIDWLRLQLSARGTIWVYSFRGMTPFGICAVKESFTIAFCCSFEWTQWKYASKVGEEGVSWLIVYGNLIAFFNRLRADAFCKTEQTGWRFVRAQGKYRDFMAKAPERLL